MDKKQIQDLDVKQPVAKNQIKEHASQNEKTPVLAKDNGEPRSKKTKNTYKLNHHFHLYQKLLPKCHI